MGRTLLLASAAMLWVISPAWADDPAGVDSGHPAAEDTGTLDDTGTFDDTGTAGDAPIAGDAGDLHKMGAGTAQEIEAGLIAKNPTQYYDKEVRVKAKVSALHGTTAFTLDEDELFAGPDILVVAPQLENIEPNTIVTVRGTVRQLVTAELEEDYSWFRPDSVQPDLLVRFKERPVIVAESVESPTGEQLITKGALEKGGSSAGDAPESGDTLDDDPLENDPMDLNDEQLDENIE